MAASVVVYYRKLAVSVFILVSSVVIGRIRISSLYEHLNHRRWLSNEASDSMCTNHLQKHSMRELNQKVTKKYTQKNTHYEVFK